ncbi:glycosyltransferase [Brevibacillus fulvus]|uniref:Glycosyltransferase involved in cell wall biosynthesis n=1 Tax=Brevibacillus fulvus TaxID=1125967 RepID=A0A938XYN4_9BACL|nr:glycosyltransferase [Brevibacillus fulvus]MBM7590105.1 glycosyltransferase involved in cell wall biosynthesis [Brevibacillus fulvus]
MNSKLHVLHVIGGGEFGGAEQHILNLLTAFPQGAVEATVVCFYDSHFAAELRKAGIEVVTLEQYGRFDLRLLRALRQVFQNVKPDIIHTHGVKANFFARIAGRGLAAPLVTTVHSNLRYDYINPFAYLIVTLMERSTRHWNRHFIAVSGAIGDILRNEGVSPEKISVIYNGMDFTALRQTERRQLDREQLRAEWNIPADAFLFGTVARFVPVKGLPYLVEAFASLVKSQPDSGYRLVMVGDGVERPLLEQKVKELGVEQLVHFAGFRHDIPACLHAIDTFVHSSIYEGLGYTIIEAMASEVPVVATNAGGVKEIVADGQTGLLVKPQDASALAAAMQRLAENPALRSAFAKQALTLVESTFTITGMARQTLALYDRLLKHGPLTAKRADS